MMHPFKSAPKDFPWGIIESQADLFNLDPLLVAAICLKESVGNTWATRMEFKAYGGAFKSLWRYFLEPDEWARVVGSSKVTEWVCQASSWGLMQVMGTVAREYGFNGWLSELCKPSVGVRYGCKHLRKKIDRYVYAYSDGFAIDCGIAAYNAGSARFSTGRKFVNQSYVDGVKAMWDQLKMEKEEYEKSRNCLEPSP